MLAAQALPHLDGFNDANQVLDAYEKLGPRAFGPITPRAAALDVADLLLARNRRSDAQHLLEDYVESVRLGNHSGHKEYLRKYLAERGFQELGEPL